MRFKDGAWVKGIAQEVTVAVSWANIWEELITEQQLFSRPQWTTSKKQNWQGCFSVRATEPAIVWHSEPGFLLQEILHCIIWDLFQHGAHQRELPYHIIFD